MNELTFELTFPEKVKSTLGESVDSSVKTKRVIELQQELMNKMEILTSLVESGKTIDQSTFDDLFSSPIIELQTILTDEEFCKIFDIDKQEFNSLIEFFIERL